MKKNISILISVLLLFSFSLAIVPKAFALQKVKGYTTKKGKYVAPHYRSSPNRSKFDNYSTKGNTNPYTGKKGTINPLKKNK